MNMSANTASQQYTPHQMVYGTKPMIPTTYFGETGVTYAPERSDTTQRGEWAIMIHQIHARSYRVFIPSRNIVVTRRKFVSNPNYPAEWKLNARIQMKKALTPTINLNPDPEMNESQRQRAITEDTVPTTTTPAAQVPLQPLRHEEADVHDQEENSVHDDHVETPTVEQSINEPVITEIQTEVREAQRRQEEAEEQLPAQPITTPMVSTNSRPTRAATQRTWRDGPVNARNETESYAMELCYRYSIAKAMKDKDKRELVLESIHNEIDNLESSKAIFTINYEDIPVEMRDEVINGFMFLVDKFKADGTIDKVKSRFVVNGAEQKEATVGETFSPTINATSIMVFLNLAAHLKTYRLSAHDIRGAFLHTSIKKRIFVRIPKDVAEIWTKRYPERARHLNDNGTMYGELGKCMYGLREAPHEFNGLFAATMTNLGFKPTKADQCFYTRKDKNGHMFVIDHSDDFSLLAPGEEEEAALLADIRKTFQDLKSQYENISYLGMNIKRNAAAGTVTINQEGLVKELLKKYNIKHHRSLKIPATSALLENEKTELLEDKSDYRSLTMALMYIARITRMDILFAVTVLSTKMQSPTVGDMENLMRVLRYLSGSVTTGILLRNPTMVLRASADASHWSHPDGKGHGGMILDLGSGPIFWRSMKLKCATRSSTESELVMLEEATTYVVWVRQLLAELGFKQQEPTVVFQDNKSTIVLAKRGPTFKRNKHMMGKYAFVHQSLEDGVIRLQYVRTEMMRADILTKPTTESVLKHHMTSSSFKDVLK
jgi:hypothetical protein